MEFRISIDVDAPAETVWSVLADVEAWPEWTPSMKRVELLADSSLTLGSRVRIRQPRFPAVVWRVTDFQPGRSFTWTARSPGMTSEGSHEVVARGDGGSTVTLAIEQRGLLAPLFGRLTSSLTRRYVEMEAEGVKRRSEARPSEESASEEP